MAESTIDVGGDEVASIGRQRHRPDPRSVYLRGPEAPRLTGRDIPQHDLTPCMTGRRRETIAVNINRPCVTGITERAGEGS